MSDWLLAVHCGAGRYGSSNEAAYLSLLRSALESAHHVIANARSPPTAPQIAVHLLHSFENSILTNAGLGANLTEEGHVECEASVVCGQTHFVSCCGAVRGVKEPCALALKLLEQAQDSTSNPSFAFGRQPPLVVVGEHARHLAQGFGLETADEDAEELKKYQVTEKNQEHWNKWHSRFQAAETSEERLDTVGAICMDPMGNVAAALSSGGVAYKVPGRLGLAGCPRMGCDASNANVMTRKVSGRRKRKRNEKTKKENAFAVVCTGRGEHFIRSNFVGALSRRLMKSTDIERELRKTFTEMNNDNGVGIEGGVLAFVSPPTTEDENGEPRRVQLGVAFTTPCMGVGFVQCRAKEEPDVHVQVLRRPPTSQGSGEQGLAIHVSVLRLTNSAST